MTSFNPRFSPIFAYNNNDSFFSKNLGHTSVWILTSIYFFFLSNIKIHSIDVSILSYMDPSC